jgi:hypothetical protein
MKQEQQQKKEKVSVDQKSLDRKSQKTRMLMPDDTAGYKKVFEQLKTAGLPAFWPNII